MLLTDQALARVPPAPARRETAAAAQRAIVTARVLAIFFMMYVHAWAGDARLPDEAFTGRFGVLAEFLVDVMGRTSVPLLTIISGYLLYTVSSASRGYRDLLVGKFRTLLVPMWLWNGLLLLLVYAGMQLKGAPAPDYVSELGVINAVFALTDRPATLPLAFLRDMFVCALISPLLVVLLRAALWPTLLAGFLFAILKPDQFVILRHQLLLFYMVGLAFAIHWKVPTSARFGPAGGAALLVVASWFLLWEGPLAGQLAFDEPVRQLFANLSRLAVAWLMWNACLWLQARPAYRLFARVEVVIFLAFCSHFLLFRALGQLFPDDSPLIPLLFLVQPPLAIGFAFLTVLVLRPTVPSLLKLLNGGRVPRVRG